MQITNDRMKPSALLGDVMSTAIRAATADQTLEEIDHHFKAFSGLPVIDENLRCIGVISKTDKAKASQGSSTVGLTPDGRSNARRLLAVPSTGPNGFGQSHLQHKMS
ncbi:hypothetical protein KSP39_PZI005033 [Platanthera zijinensis]|uniref:CBS domain-containing protein n=1 Tax=Platanthera zijinensis TaxID=2320716 RepID=A0AAP0BTV6_9ASPA